MNSTTNSNTMTSSQGADVSGFVDNWQAEKTLAECNLHMFVTEDSCDVTFLCGSQGIMVRAHRYVLKSRSCVFHPMFSGSMSDRNEVSIPEIDHQFFKQFLTYIYTDNTTIDSNNVTALLYASRKYAIISLEKLCAKFLEENLTVDNACIILEAAHRFDQKQLFESTLSLIKGEGERALQSPGFLTLGQELVDLIVESDDLVANEHVIFTAVNSWTLAECGRRGSELTPQAKRSVLGNTLMKVRFPLMKQSFMVKDVKISGLLTDCERLMLLEYSVSPDIDVKPFITKERCCSASATNVGHTLTVSECRFQRTVNNLDIVPRRPRTDAISFRSNRNLTLYGYRLYGPSSQANTEYWVTTYFGVDDSVSDSMIQGKTAYTADDEVFDVMFSDPVRMTVWKWYTLTVVTEGPLTWTGEGGVRRVKCDHGVKIKFRPSAKRDNYTDVSEGQIPSLIYRLT